MKQEKNGVYENEISENDEMLNNTALNELHKEIDLIQNCITRMAQNSFIIKGWAFMLVVGLIALTSDKFNLYILCGIGIFILIIFWYLDAFFLKMEKLYRFKYEWVIAKRVEGIKDYMYDLNPHQSKTRMPEKVVPSVGSVMFSEPHTLLLFYGSPIVIGLLVILLRILCLI